VRRRENSNDLAQLRRNQKEVWPQKTQKAQKSQSAGFTVTIRFIVIFVPFAFFAAIRSCRKNKNLRDINETDAGRFGCI
jgi:hypothetical protein